MMKGELQKSRVVVKKEENNDWRVLWGKGIGESKEEELELKPVEVLYLKSKGELSVVDEGGEVTEAELIRTFSKRDERFWNNFLLYVDLRSRGYNLTLHQGKMEIYARGDSPLSSDPVSVMIPVPALAPIRLKSLIKEVKRAKERDLNLILGIVDRDGTVTYYRVGKAFKGETKLKLRQRGKSSR